jgi:hypothetical protein
VVIAHPYAWFCDTMLTGGTLVTRVGASTHGEDGCDGAPAQPGTIGRPAW